MRSKILRLVAPLVLGTTSLLAQTSAPASAPPQTVTTPAPPMPQAPGPPAGQQQQAKVPTTGARQPLTIQDAEALALKNNPRISVYHLLALASNQVTREQKSAYYPNIYGSLTAVEPKEGSRIAAGFLNNPSIYERAAGGLTLSQLITDFGRTSNLVATSALRAKAADMNSVATADEVKLAVDQAFYNALQALAEQRVAEETVKARQLVSDQITTLYNNKLRSQLDVSFADANLAQAKLLLLDAQNNENSAFATLSMVLGYPTLQNFQLVEDTSQLAPPPANVDDLISQAFALRPEILSLQFQYQSARKFQTAERDLLFPSIRALGAVGDTPVGNVAVAPNPGALSNTYGAVGANVEIPLFNGFLYTARAREANLRAQATQERLADMRNLISRDVRTSWLNANTAYQRLSVTQQLLQQANLALDLAQSRYNLGLGSIVELSQAQLQQTQAQISYAQAGYDYRLSLAVLTYETTGI